METWQTISIFIGVCVAMSAVQIKAYDWLLRRHLELFEARFHSAESRLEKLETGLAELNRECIKRDDWMKQTLSLEMKLGDLSSRIAELRVDHWRGGRDANS